MRHGVKYALKKILLTIPILVGISLFAFILGLLGRGDPASVQLSADPDYIPSQEEIYELQEELGLHDPILVQYGRWVGDVLQGNLGNSLIDNKPVFQEMTRRLPNTLLLSGLSLCVILICGVTGGVLLAIYKDTLVDVIGRCLLVTTMSLPGFCMGYLLIWLFAQTLKILPTSGATSWQSYVLPCAVLSIGSSCLVARLLRASILGEQGKNYVLTAKAKGLTPHAILFRHTLRNSVVPSITYMANIFGGLLGGSMITETIFAVPGVGSYALGAIGNRDYVAVQGYVLFTGLVFVLVCTVADILCACLNPQINLEA